MKRKGFIIQVLLIIVALGALAFYFGWDIINFVKKPEIQKVLTGLWNGVTTTWSYIKAGFNYVVGLFT